MFSPAGSISASQELDRGHVVDAGVTENMLVRLLRADIAAATADDDTEFGFEDDASLVTPRAINRFVGADDAGHRFHEIQWCGRNRLAFGRGALVEVVPQRQDRIWRIGREQFDLGQRGAFPGQYRLVEQAVAANCDVVTLEHAQVCVVVALEAYPASHCYRFMQLTQRARNLSHAAAKLNLV
jgi:hypothetical protein